MGEEENHQETTACHMTVSLALPSPSPKQKLLLIVWKERGSFFDSPDLISLPANAVVFQQSLRRGFYEKYNKATSEPIIHYFSY